MSTVVVRSGCEKICLRWRQQYGWWLYGVDGENWVPTDTAAVSLSLNQSPNPRCLIFLIRCVLLYLLLLPRHLTHV